MSSNTAIWWGHLLPGGHKKLPQHKSFLEHFQQLIRKLSIHDVIITHCDALGTYTWLLMKETEYYLFPNLKLKHDEINRAELKEKGRGGAPVVSACNNIKTLQT